MLKQTYQLQLLQNHKMGLEKPERVLMIKLKHYHFVAIFIFSIILMEHSVCLTALKPDNGFGSNKPQCVVVQEQKLFRLD